MSIHIDIFLEGLVLKENDEILLDGRKYFLKRVNWKNNPNASILQIDGKKNLNSDEDLDFISRIVTAFRLSDKGGIGYNQFLYETDYEIVNGGLPLHFPKLIKEDYNFCKETKKKIQERFVLLNNIPWNNTKTSILQLALNRFNRSYYEGYTEGVLVDLVICMEILYASESCYFCGNDRHAYLNSIQNLTPIFFKKHSLTEFLDKPKTGVIRKGKKEEKQLTQPEERLGAFYEMRNKILHVGMRFMPISDETDSKQYTFGDIFEIDNLKEFIFEIRDYARNSLICYFDEYEENLDLKKVKESLEIRAMEQKIDNKKQFDEDLKKLFRH